MNYLDEFDVSFTEEQIITSVSVESVVQTKESTEDNGVNTLEVTLTDGTKSQFNVRNGSQGSQGEVADLDPLLEGLEAVTVELGNKANSSDVFEVTEQAQYTNQLDNVTLTPGMALNGSGNRYEYANTNLATHEEPIPVTTGAIIRMKGISISTASEAVRVIFYDADDNMLAGADYTGKTLGAKPDLYNCDVLEQDADGNITSFQVKMSGLHHIRICVRTADIGTNPILTVNEEIPEDAGAKKLNHEVKVDYSQLENVPPQKDVVQTIGNSETAVMSQKAVTNEIAVLNDDILQQNFKNSFQNGVAYSGSVGSVITTVTNAARAIFGIHSYSKDVFVIPKLGYMMLVYYLDDNNIVTESAKYWANGGVIPKNQRFAIAIYNNANSTATMTDEEAVNVVTIQNEEAKKEKRRICGAFLDGVFANIAYSHLLPFVAPVNTAEHYLIAAKTDGFEAIKGDVQITSDNYLVMCHDKGFTLDENGRITTFDASNCTLIRNMTYAQVMALEHAVQYNETYMHPTDIDGLLRVCKRYGKFPYITIRDENMDVIAPILVAKLKSYGLETHCIVNSFTLESLATVRQYSDVVFLSQVLEEDQKVTDPIINRINQYGNVVITTFDNDGTEVDASLEKIELAKSMGIRIFGAIFKDASNVEKLLNYGFSGCQSYVPFV